MQGSGSQEPSKIQEESKEDGHQRQGNNLGEWFANKVRNREDKKVDKVKEKAPCQ